MLPVHVLELGNIYQETSTKDQCEKHCFSNMRSLLPERNKRKKEEKLKSVFPQTWTHGITWTVHCTHLPSKTFYKSS